MTIETAPAATTVTHGTFTLERTYTFDRPTVFGAWATRNAKNQWFGEGEIGRASCRERVFSSV